MALRVAKSSSKELIVHEKYRLDQRLGNGGQGQVWKATDLDTKETVAVKIGVEFEGPESMLKPFVVIEFEMYQRLQGLPGLPKIFWFGEEKNFQVMVMELLGPSLEDLFEYCHGHFTLRTVLMLADQLITRLETLHNRGIIHRDISPVNLLMGLGAYQNRVYMVDLGSSCREKDRCTDAGLIGQPIYCSIAGHHGHAQTPRDDLESLLYVLIRFLKGSLPWESDRTADGVEIQTGQWHGLILRKKESMSAAELCEGLPKEFLEYHNHIRGAKNGVDYKFLRENFYRLLRREGDESVRFFDWIVVAWLASLESNKGGTARSSLLLGSAKFKHLFK